MSLAPAVGLGWLAVNAPGYLRFRAALDTPRRVQTALLQGYLRANAETVFGRAHAFAEIRSIAEYQERVPLHGYAELAPCIERIAAGERDVLTAERVHVLESTGGSTRRKRIPYTSALQAELRRAVAPWLCDLWRQEPGLFLGRSYWSISPVLSSEASTGGVPEGFEDDAQYLGGVWAQLVRSTLAVPSEVRLIEDIETFRYVTLLFLLRASDLTLISVWHPSFLTLLLSRLAVHWDRLVADVHAGGVRPPSPLPASVAARLMDRLPPRPRRARELAAAGPEARARAQLWPRLRILSCWGDGHAALHLEEARRSLPGVAIQPKGLLATEGCVTLPFEGATPMATRSHFFELLDARGRPHLVDEAERGETYSVVITTGGGLYRYRLGDRVRCTGFIRATPTLAFLGKEGHVSDLVGEKLGEDIVAETLERIFALFDLHPRFALLAPDPSERHLAGYTLYVEVARPIPSALAAALEAALQEHGDYRYAARLGQLAPVRVFHVHGGGEAAFLTRARANGQKLGDVKPLALSPSRGWSDVLAGAYVDGAMTRAVS